ncbi:MAG: NAD(P)/FAD-dependent oxidoreductase [Verrucomicrobiales bacterium]
MSSDEIPLYSELPSPMDPASAPQAASHQTEREVIIIGGGLAGLSAAIYLARALRDVLVIDAGESLAMWEPEVQNYLGFPEGIDGKELLKRGRAQAEHYGAEFLREEIESALKEGDHFQLQGKKNRFRSRRLLLATGLYHLPPKIPCVNECLGKSMFFCKDCDGYRVQGKRVLIIGHNDEAVEYALGILQFTACVAVATNGEVPRWNEEHARWLKEYEIEVHETPIQTIHHQKGFLQEVGFQDGSRMIVDCLFTTRGDVFHNVLAKQLGAQLDEEGQVATNHCQLTNIAGLYAAGCITPANCQMIIAAGDGAAAGQAINRDLFQESLRNHALRRKRSEQLRSQQAAPPVIPPA